MSRNEQVKSDMQRAKALIQQQKYDEARSILMTIDHPTADKWLDRINAMTASSVSNQPTSVTVQQVEREKSFTGKLFISIVLLLFWFVPGVIALAIFAPEAKKYPDASGAKALIWLNRITFWLMIIGSVLFIVLFVVAFLFQ